MKRKGLWLACLMVLLISGLYAGGGIKEPVKDGDALVYGYLEVAPTLNHAAGWIGISQIFPVIDGLYMAGQRGKVFFLGGPRNEGIYRLAQWGYSYTVGRTTYTYTFATGLQGQDMSVDVSKPGFYYMGAWKMDGNKIVPSTTWDEEKVLQELLVAFANYPTWKKKVQDRLELYK